MVLSTGHTDRDSRGRSLERSQHWASRNNHVDLLTNQFGCEHTKLLDLAFRTTRLSDEMLSEDIAELTQTAQERLGGVSRWFGADHIGRLGTNAKHSDTGDFTRLLRACCHRPRRSTTKQRYELPPLHLTLIAA